MQRYIGLLDCNNFFVSCERLFRPDLRNRPTVVLSSNDGCVVARSQEIKDMGIPMGVPYFQIKDRLKDSKAAVFSSNFAHYRDISARVFSVMKRHVDTVEQYSIDEAFCLLQGETDEAIVEEARSLRDRVWREVGIPVSVGIAATKTRAKLANAIAKKGGGVQLITETLWPEVAQRTPLHVVWGVGAGRLRQFKEAGLETVADLCQADSARIAQKYGVGGVRLQQELNGKTAFFVERKRELQQSLMSTRSFADSTTKLSVLEDAIAYHIRQALEELRSMHAKASVLRVMIRPSRHGDYFLRGGTKEVVFTTPTSDTIEYLEAAMPLVRGLYESEVPYKKAGVILSGIVPEGHAQGNLFANTVEVGRDKLMNIVDSLNQKLGRETVKIGSRNLTGEWRTKRDLISPAYTTRWSDIATVKAL